MSVSNIISLLGGVALFLFGMTLMGEGLKKVAGNKMELVLYRLSSTPLKGVFLGTAVTAIIQSSSATSVMVVGFVNSGMMKMEQAVAIIEGALIGTSVTGWIICLSSVEGSGWVSLLSTSTLTAVVAVIGIILRMFSKKQLHWHVGDILLGFAVLMFGMQSMSGAVSPLRQSPEFIHLLTTFSNPVLGIIVGMVFTAVLQSASAAVGILQALSMTGAVTFATAYPLILGIAIGAAVPVLLSALGAKTEGRRTAFLYLVIEIAAVAVCAALYYGISAFVDLGLSGLVMSPVTIALVNSVFRALSVAILLPFNKLLLAFVETIIRVSEEERSVNASLDRLDERFLAHPALAIEQSRLTVNDMADASQTNFFSALNLLAHFSEEDFRRVEKGEDKVDEFEDKIGTYLMGINANELDRVQNENLSKYLHTLSDFERISDHAMNIAEAAREIAEKKLYFSEAARRELSVLSTAVSDMVSLCFESFKKNNVEDAFRVEPFEERIDILCDEMKLRHVDRLQNGVCSLGQGFVFNDLVTNLERVADHCSNIAIAMIELQADTYDAHSYVINMKELHSHRFDEYYEEYSKKYEI
ncbi:MAG: Na/Pi cotransporter family protein [Candidatus Limivicinus sp.]|nr:Na/Pi cotransporter family protein [Clostridiales bacterium]MDY6132377.1 Na/Pi cotransporter family protein [Candidatus Limivicinus sp.]